MTIGDYTDNSKKLRRQNRKSMQTTLKVVSRESSPLLSISSSSQKIKFTPYLSEESVEMAIRRGNAFKAIIRVNAHNRLEAYCSIKGIPIDVLINGVEAQNRAIEGDLVAVALDPLINWSKLKVANANANANDGINSSTEQEEVDKELARICFMINSHPLKRPTGRVLAILRKSPKRSSVIGFLSLKQVDEVERIMLIHTDSRFPKMIVSVRSLPDSVRERVKAGDITVERELVAAEMYEWKEESLYPNVRVIDVFGRGGEIEPRIAAILFENSISSAKYSLKSLAFLPDKSWKVPFDEYISREDFRKFCCFTIDPSSAVELDDALSVEMLSDEVIRIGVHIADVSYFVLPDTTLDDEAQARSTSVYILQHKLPMLPPEISEELCSLLPGEDRLALSIVWDINLCGEIIRRWIGRSIINSCCKLSYDFVQAVIDKSFDVDEPFLSSSIGTKLYGHFSFKDVIESLKILYEISTKLRKTRFNDGALQLETVKIGFLFDEHGIPYDSMISERMIESCSLVEEFMLLANRSVAEVISQAFPDSSFLRRHPEPILRKLKEFEAFCSKHGLELDTSSSGQLHLSLLKIKEEIKNDPVLFDIIISYASKPMQPALYFSTGELKGRQNEWAHYALNFPLYTHFTSPIRRYPDIIVHRILCAVLLAEKMYLKQCADKLESSETEIVNACFTGLCFNKQAAESTFGREALSASAFKFKIPGGDALGEIAAHCNERILAGRRAEEAGEKLYLWALLKKETSLVTEARVLAVGPRFMSIYIPNFGIERRIYYDEVDCLAVEWLELTGKLVLDLIRSKIRQRRDNLGNFRPLEDVILLTDPSALDLDEEGTETVIIGPRSANVPPSYFSEKVKLEAVFFPQVLQNLSYVPVALHAIGGDDGTLDIGAKLYVSSYFS